MSQKYPSSPPSEPPVDSTASKPFDASNSQTPPPMKWVREFLNWVIVIVVAFFAAYLINHYLLINAQVPTGSMEETIPTGSRLFGNRLAYLFSDVSRGDIIIFKYPLDTSQNYIKRVIGLPGDTVTIRAGKIYINDSQTPLEETYLPQSYLDSDLSEQNFGPYEVPEDAYFVLGDNRAQSSDSRVWGFVPKEDILGKAIFMYWKSFKLLNTHINYGI